MYKDDYLKIKKFVEEILIPNYNFLGPTHMTDFNNFINIMKEGYLYSRHDCRNKRIKFTDGADESVIKFTAEEAQEYVRFYYRTNTPTLYCNEGIKQIGYCNNSHLPIPVYLIFDYELLYLDSTFYLNGSAAKIHTKAHITNVGDDAEFFKYRMYWDKVFHNGPIKYYEDNKEIVNRRNSELLSEVPVSIEKYLRKIVFRCEADRKRAINILGYDDRYDVNIKLFSDKNFNIPNDDKYVNNFIGDYALEYEYDEDYNIKSIILRLGYKLDPSETEYEFLDYNYEIVILDKYDKEVEDIEVDFIEHDKFFTDYSGDKVVLKGNFNDVDKIQVLINNYLCVDEIIIKNVDKFKDGIEKFRIFNHNSEIGKRYLIKVRYNKNLNFAAYVHRYKIYDSNENIICDKIAKPILNPNKNIIGLYIDYYRTFSKIEYFVNNIHCLTITMEDIK